MREWGLPPGPTQPPGPGQTPDFALSWEATVATCQHQAREPWVCCLGAPGWQTHPVPKPGPGATRPGTTADCVPMQHYHGAAS